MKKSVLTIVLAVTALLMGNVAQAGFVNPDEVPDAVPFNVNFNSGDWNFDYSGPTLT